MENEMKGQDQVEQVVGGKRPPANWMARKNKFLTEKQYKDFVARKPIPVVLEYQYWILHPPTLENKKVKLINKYRKDIEKLNEKLKELEASCKK